MNKCWCGSGLDYEVCHREFDKKINYYKKRGVMTPPRSMIKNQQQIEGLLKVFVHLLMISFVMEFLLLMLF